MFWIGVGLIVLGTTLAIVGQLGARNVLSVKNAKGNFAQGATGSVNQTYTEAPSTAPAAPSPPSFEDRFLKWGGFAIGLAGIGLALVKYLGGG